MQTSMHGIKKYDANVGRQVRFTQPVLGDRWDSARMRYNTIAPAGATGTITGYTLVSYDRQRYAKYYVRLDGPGEIDTAALHPDLQDGLNVEWVKRPRGKPADGQE